MRKIIIILTVFLLCTSQSFAAKLSIDTDSSDAAFVVEHKVGYNAAIINNVSGTMELKKLGSELKDFDIELDMSDIDSFNEDRNRVLKSEEMFNVNAYPVAKIQFKEMKGEEIIANVTFMGKTKPVSFGSVLWGISVQKDGTHKTVVTLVGTLNRLDFGFDYNVSDEKGEDLLGKDLGLKVTLKADYISHVKE